MEHTLFNSPSNNPGQMVQQGSTPIVLSSHQLASLLEVSHQDVLHAAQQFGEAEKISPESMGLMLGDESDMPYYTFMGARGKKISIRLAEQLAPINLDRLQILWGDPPTKVIETKPQVMASSQAVRAYVTSGEIAELIGKAHYYVSRWADSLSARNLISKPHRVSIPVKYNMMTACIFMGEAGERDSLLMVEKMAPKAVPALRLLWAQRKVIAWDMMGKR